MTKFKQLFLFIAPLLAVVVFLSFSSFKSPNDDRGILLVRVLEPQKTQGCLIKKLEGRIVIVNPNGSFEETEIGAYDFNKMPSGMGAISAVLNKVYNRGYRLRSLSSDLWPCFMVSNYVFEK